MFVNHLNNKSSEINNLWANSSFDVSGIGVNGGGEEISKLLEVKQQTDNSRSHSQTTAAAATAAEEAQVVQMGHKRSRNGKAVSGGGGGGAGESSEHEMHILTERERRKKMRNMFSNLHALLPHLPPKADKSTIVDEAVKYIKTLQQTQQTLEKQKVEKLKGGATISDHHERSIISSPVQVEAFDSREAFLADHHHHYQGTSVPKNLSMAASKNIPHSLQVVPPPPPQAACFQTWFSPNVVVNMCGDDAQISVCSPTKPELLTTIFYILEKHNLDVVSAHISSDGYRSIYMIHAHAGGASSQYLESLTVEEIFKLAVGEMNLWLLTC